MNKDEDKQQSSRQATVAKSYVELRAINLGAKVLDGYLETGELLVRLGGDLKDEFGEIRVEGKLYKNGILSGLSKIYAEVDFREGDTVDYVIQSSGGEPNVVLTSLNRSEPVSNADKPKADEGKAYETVLHKKRATHIHIEPFRPENLDHWSPITETDVYMAFGVLQDLTDYQYCCGAGAEILSKLGLDYNGTAKPDAILVSRVTDEYLIAEWKMNSSDFTSNHSSEDVDVLVCWVDDEENRDDLPENVLELRSTAKSAVENILSGL